MEVLTGPPGSGKTHLMRTEAVSEAGLYAFAYPSIELLEEQAAEFTRTGLPSWKVHSKTNGRRAIQDQLARQLAALRAAEVDHAAILMTHSALVQCDLSAMPGWRWRIDEAPTFHSNGTLKVTGADLSLWNEAVELVDRSQGWSRAVARQDRSLRDIKQGLFKPQAAFLHAASRGAALIQAEELRAGPHKWLSVWTPLSLPSPHSIVIGGAGFSRSISALLLERLFASEITIHLRTAARPRTAMPHVCVHYFADWEATSGHWSTRAGRGDLKAIAEHIRAQDQSLGYWSGNEQVQILMDHYIAPNEALRPRLAGLNKHDQAASCALIYSSKGTPEDHALTSAIGLTPGQIRAAREDEDIFQFVFRGAIRRPDYGGRYDIWLFSRPQAERLNVRLVEAGLSPVSLKKADADVAAERPTPAKKGRKKANAGESVEERRERLAERKREERARKRLSQESGQTATNFSESSSSSPSKR